MCHIFFFLSIHPSVGHLVCFHCLAIINNAIVNTAVQLSEFLLLLLLVMYPEVELLSWPCGNSVFYFLGNYHTVFHSGKHSIYTNLGFFGHNIKLREKWWHTQVISICLLNRFTSASILPHFRYRFLSPGTHVCTLWLHIEFEPFGERWRPFVPLPLNVSVHFLRTSTFCHTTAVQWLKSGNLMLIQCSCCVLNQEIN